MYTVAGILPNPHCSRSLLNTGMGMMDCQNSFFESFLPSVACSGDGEVDVSASDISELELGAVV